MAVELIHGDCLEVMKDIPDGSVDCVITDPPYGVRDDDWDAMNSHEFAQFNMEWLSACRRVSPTLVAFCCEKTLPDFYALCRMMYPRVRMMFWDKPWGSQYAGSAENGIWFAHEIILYCYSPDDLCKSTVVADLIRTAREAKGLSRGGVDMVVRGKKTGLCYRWEESACLPTDEQAEKLKELLNLNGELTEALRTARNQTRDAKYRDVFSYRTEIRGLHPCQKPIGLMGDLIRAVTEDGQKILDPFAGSGSTGVACVLENRNFIGIEKDADYFEIAKKRIAEAQVKEPLFV